MDAAAGKPAQPSSWQADQSNYLGNVLRLAAGDDILVFNGRDGEWQASIAGRKRPDSLEIRRQTRPQDRLPDLAYVFAPLKHARLDYMVQKAVEMGASSLQPVLTRFTQVSRVNGERMRANVIEAAEQCGILGIADVAEPVALDRFWSSREGRPPAGLLRRGGRRSPTRGRRCRRKSRRRWDRRTDRPRRRICRGGAAVLLRQPNCLRLSLGPRILRADTAGVAALALVQAALGDWTGPLPETPARC